MTERITAARSRLADIGWRSVTIAGAAAAIGIVALVASSDPGPPSARYAVADSSDTQPPATADPLRAELMRCRTLPADADDARCRAAWEANRRRFMGESRSYVAPTEPPAAEPAPISNLAAAPIAIPRSVGR